MHIESSKLVKTKIINKTRKMLADTVTPVSIYLKIRDKFSQTILLESTDFSSKENSFSFIAMEPLAGIELREKQLTLNLASGEKQEQQLTQPNELEQIFDDFMQSFEVDENALPIVNGVFGHCSFEAVQYFDNIDFDSEKRDVNIPDFHYNLYRYVIAINHYKDELFILENLLEGENSELDKIETLIRNNSYAAYNFSLSGKETSNLTDAEYMRLVTLGKEHCFRGDVFQIVLSRRFSQSFQGDDFNVYRTLRSINPSPYLFYFDYGNYKIFGSSPEAQLVIKNGMAEVNPIAGTYRRTGNDLEDQVKARELAEDPKENAEHIMLVDLARNDLGRHATKVNVKKLKEIQYFSHVIHLVSKVEGELPENYNPIQVFGDSFPAGTLSGAPKYKAIELIGKYEKTNRSFYGGAIGYIGFNGELNQAIVIRSFLSKDNVLHYQAGAGIVASSKEESELKEVGNKLAALKKALIEAQKI